MTFSVDFNLGAEEQYLALLQNILTHGNHKGDRTGTGTQDLFGYQLRIDLQRGFPLLTTKKMFHRGLVEELLWMLRGDTNVKSLQEKNVHIWDEWSDSNGELGPVYGQQFRCSSYYKHVTPLLFEPDPEPDFMSWALPGKGALRREEEEETRLVCNGGIYGNYDRNDLHVSLLKDVWRRMISRCYNPNDPAYEWYGGVGVHVSSSWRVFANFLKEVKQIPNWCSKQDLPDSYSLDKDTLYASNRYSLKTCMWATRIEQSQNTTQSKPFVALSPDETITLFTSKSGALKLGLDPRSVAKCLNGERAEHKGWSQFRWIEFPDTVLRFRHVDQIQEALSELRYNSQSRRHIVSLWSPGETGEMALPPCHGLTIQFSVESGLLHCHMYQRSADCFLGLPFNIASYAVLTHIMATLTGLSPGLLLLSIGSAHIYNNHRDQVAEQLSRKPFNLPTLQIRTFNRNPEASPTTWSIDDFLAQCKGAEDFEFLNYESHPAIKADVAI